VPNPLTDQGYVVINGEALLATAIASPAGLNATPLLTAGGRVVGLAYLVPKPVELQGYAVIKGVVP
jgi:hypothetical protein